ncbi:hypothetical protein IMCC3317_47210 [Kordia antarctica]|uniref:Anti-sigma-K factor rskA n=1 Tax=Kordia antarctica TaxID=1218801 RepID=A0A7L4ZS42_9FLAO|nr:anti-sigma factor [Kordia antarctica]QHI39311.1 hypothetical protein IMCC3317_47210 [Kordia antarctica]
MKKSLMIASMFIGIIAFSSCSSDDGTPPVPTSTLTVNLNGVAPLPSNFVYEGWIVVNNTPISTGRFNTGSVNSTQTFTLVTADLDVATEFILSIELATGDDPAPSNTKILKGGFVANAATLSINSVVGNFANTTTPFSGSFVTDTPTDNVGGVDNGNNDRGVWFIQNMTTAGLINLPQLSAGWKYEGWAVFNTGSAPATTGKFTSANAADSSSPYSGNEPAPLFPGEDFLFNLPAGIDGIVTGLPVVISVEPDLVGDPNEPFFLKPITGTEGISNNGLSVTNNINATINGTAVR